MIEIKIGKDDDGAWRAVIIWPNMRVSTFWETSELVSLMTMIKDAVVTQEMRRLEAPK